MKLYSQDNLFGDERQFNLVFSMRELEKIRMSDKDRLILHKCDNILMFDPSMSNKVIALATMCKLIEDKQNLDENFKESLELLGSLDTKKEVL